MTNGPDWKELEHIGEFAAGAYWMNKVAQGDTDPVESEGRIGGSTYVRSNVEYAAVAGGQLAVGHLLWAGLAKLLLIPFWTVTFIIFMGAPLLLLKHACAPVYDPVTAQMTPHIPFLLGLLCEGTAFLLWLYICCWRLTMKPILRGILKRGPSITPADGYRGPLGTSQTVYTERGYQQRRW